MGMMVRVYPVAVVCLVFFFFFSVGICFGPLDGRYLLSHDIKLISVGIFEYYLIKPHFMVYLRAELKILTVCFLLPVELSSCLSLSAIL